MTCNTDSMFIHWNCFEWSSCHVTVSKSPKFVSSVRHYCSLSKCVITSSFQFYCLNGMSHSICSSGTIVCVNAFPYTSCIYIQCMYHMCCIMTPPRVWTYWSQWNKKVPTDLMELTVHCVQFSYSTTFWDKQFFLQHNCWKLCGP